MPGVHNRIHTDPKHVATLAKMVVETNGIAIDKFVDKSAWDR